MQKKKYRNESENLMEKERQIENLREKNTEISWKNKKRRQTDVNRQKKRRLLKFQKETNWQLKRKEYRNIIVK